MHGFQRPLYFIRLVACWEQFDRHLPNRFTKTDCWLPKNRQLSKSKTVCEAALSLEQYETFIVRMLKFQSIHYRMPLVIMVLLKWFGYKAVRQTEYTCDDVEIWITREYHESEVFPHEYLDGFVKVGMTNVKVNVIYS